MKKYGFCELSRKALSDIGAVAVEYRHEISGVRLLHLERNDVNKTFMIAFKTPPTDSTGVFHIIEHSVLCGSRKYKLKDPFVELLKGSLNTFLNAMTYPDKTVYPVSSMNDRDFYNLVSVYMDAVLHPAFLECEEIFMQEGHRTELAEGGICENGVVLNEMLGAYSSPEEIESEQIMALMYPDSPYAYSSGGAPESITALTYEDFIRAYKEHYSPSNAYIVLDGEVKLDEILPLLDSYLSEYEYKPSNIKIEVPSSPLAIRKSLPYPTSQGESVENKTRMCLGIRSFSALERERNLALAVVRGAIAASQNSPFCRRVLDSGLCEDVYITPMDELARCGMAVSFVNVKDGCEDELLSLALDELHKYAKEGIDKEALRSSLSNVEFTTREKNYGSYPPGVIYALAVMESWLYSDNATLGLSYGELFSSLKEKLDGDYYESVLAEILPTKDDATVLILTPDGEYSARIEREREAQNKKIYDSMSESELDLLREKCERFDAWQSRVDSKRELECLPKLSLSDINPEPLRCGVKRSRISGCPTAAFDIETSGIAYVNAFFDVSDLTPAECTELALLSSALTKMPTDLHTEGELFSYIKGRLGFISLSPTASLHTDGRCINSLKLSLGVLSENAEYAAPIFAEVCLGSHFKTDILATLLRRTVLYMKESMCADGTSVAIDRVQSSFSLPSAVGEYYSGYEAYTALCGYMNDEGKISALCQRLESLCRRIFVRERVKLFGAGDKARSIMSGIIDALPCGEHPVPFEYKCLAVGNEGIEIPSRTSFTALGFPLPAPASAAYDVAKTLTTYEYLWNEIRATGGAYGAGEVLREKFGAFYSYRDPSPQRSLEKYICVPDFLEQLAERIEKEELEKYIIGTFSATDGVKSARVSFDLECARALRGITYERRRRRRLEMLNTDKSDILSFAKLLRKNLRRAVSCTVASHDMLAELGEKIEKINKIV